MDQSGWSWCSKCQGMFYSGGGVDGACPAGAAHDASTSGHYVLALNAQAGELPNGQSQWAWCHKCQGLGYGPQFASSHCPAGDQHDSSGSGDYTIDTEASNPPDDRQRGWRWCSRCQGMFYSGNGPGVCPAGDGHDGSTSGAYVIQMQAPQRLTTQLNPIVIRAPLLLTSLVQDSPVFTSDQAQAVVADAAAVITATTGASWCQLNAWLDWPNNAANATWLCRSTQLSIVLPAVRTDAQVLPFHTGYPTASLALAGGSLALTPALDGTGLRLIANLSDGADGNSYDEAIGALSAEGGAALTLTTAHDLTVQTTVPDPPTIPITPIPIGVLHHLPFQQAGALRIAPLAAVQKFDPAQKVSLDHNLLLPVDRTDWNRIFRPPPTTTTTSVQTTTEQSGVTKLPWHPQSDADVFPDIPRQGAHGWLQVPISSDNSVQCQPGTRPELFLYLPTEYKLGFHADDESTPSLPFRVTMERQADDSVTIKVTMTAMPYLGDSERAALRTYLLQHELGNAPPYINLMPKSGMATKFQGEFLSEGAPVAQSSITFDLAGATTSELLEIVFTMDELDYGLLVPMLQRGIRGTVVLSDDDTNVSVPVSLRLDDIVTNAITAGATTPTDGSAGPSGTVTVTNLLTYPISLGALGLDLVNIGEQSDIVFDAEHFELLPAAQAIDAGATATLTYAPTIAQATQLSVTPGVVTVNGPSPADWINAVNRDPSLQPSKVSVTLSPSVPASQLASVRSVTVTVFAAGATTPQQPPLDIVPGHDAPLTLELSLAELAAGVDVRTGFFLEFTTRLVDDTRSLPQRIALDLSRKVIDLLVLVEPSGAQYFIDSDSSVGPVSRDVAQQLIDVERAAGKTWTVRAVASTAPSTPTTPAPTG